MKKLHLLDLFSGIGGFSLGLEATGGFQTVAFCEIAPSCRRLLAAYWPGVPIYDDVQTLTASRLGTDGITVDVISGGFPCQDLSEAGRRAGFEGRRSGLWAEFLRLIRELRPCVVVVENVSNLLAGPPEQPGAWFGAFLGDLAEIGYDAEWHSIPAAYLGAPHERDRVWVVAHPRGDEHEGPRHAFWGPAAARLFEARSYDAGERQPDDQGGEASEVGAGRGAPRNGYCRFGRRDQWRVEPAVHRVADGIPARVDRLHGLGNSIIPQIAELIGLAVLEALHQSEAA